MVDSGRFANKLGARRVTGVETRHAGYARVHIIAAGTLSVQASGEGMTSDGGDTSTLTLEGFGLR